MVYLVWIHRVSGLGSHTTHTVSGSSYRYACPPPVMCASSRVPFYCSGMCLIMHNRSLWLISYPGTSGTISFCSWSARNWVPVFLTRYNRVRLLSAGYAQCWKLLTSLPDTILQVRVQSKTPIAHENHPYGFFFFLNSRLVHYPKATRCYPKLLKNHSSSPVSSVRLYLPAGSQRGAQDTGWRWETTPLPRLCNTREMIHYLGNNVEKTEKRHMLTSVCRFPSAPWHSCHKYHDDETVRKKGTHKINLSICKTRRDDRASTLGCVTLDVKQFQRHRHKFHRHLLYFWRSTMNRGHDKSYLNRFCPLCQGLKHVFSRQFDHHRCHRLGLHKSSHHFEIRRA